LGEGHQVIRKRGLGAAGAALFVLSASAAEAQTGPIETGPIDTGGTLFGWSVSGSLQARVAPDYVGSKSYSLGPGGSLQFSRPGVQSRFGAPDDSPSLEVLGGPTLSAGVVARWRSGRDDNGVLHGLNKIDWAIEPGIYGEWWPTEGLRFRAEVRHGVRGNSAWTSDLAADVVHDDPRWLLSVGPRIRLGDSSFTRTYFDVSPAEALRSTRGLGPFRADGTFVSAGGLASVEYRWSRRWSLLADMEYLRLFSDAADSPIVARVGSPDQFSGAFGLRYRFGR
jgi:outer membrane protein